ncbi:hypothetical protein PPL_02756 [Heterostelium album PN500]|uniref:Ankyrin repeat-containing protein n=1 Tax=Heterostelium pallidum (strain ATCC 26659 / Pp 5 / PN500) TaxID=670386 RepID=D3B2Z1_HETP5|nr:hypothetical protein PPL_02756 [Heterostelium album PN500]EFA83689.1 hypothetical protein PPL_02756 [Heterostelium album PN500]|eukprot:XP_020435806.1 hypothetical protein PPL_02756 [Heterostelium album PN500]
MDKSLFLSLFNNIVLNKLIFSLLRCQCKSSSCKVYSWSVMIKKPHVLAGNGYLDLLKQCRHRYHSSIRGLIFNFFKKDPMYRTLVNTTKSSHPNSLPILKYLIEEIGIDLEILLGENTRAKYTPKDLLYYASRYDRLEILKYFDSVLQKNRIDLNRKGYLVTYEDAFIVSPFSHNIDIMAFLLDKISNHPLVTKAFDSAARVGRIDMIEWLAKHRPQDRVGNFMFDQAVRGNHIDLVKYLRKENKDRDEYPEDNIFLIDTAAECGHFDLLKQLHQMNYNGTTKAMDLAASNGHLEIIEWLHHFRDEGATVLAMNGAAKNGHKDLVEWLHYNRTEGCLSYAMDDAATNGHLGIVQFLHINRTEGCSHEAFDGAAKGHLNLVEFHHHNRTEGFTTTALDLSSNNGHLHVVEWILENRTEGCTIRALVFSKDKKIKASLTKKKPIIIIIDFLYIFLLQMFVILLAWTIYQFYSKGKIFNFLFIPVALYILYKCECWLMHLKL